MDETNNDDLLKSKPQRLARLFRLAAGQQDWRSEELRAILAHHLHSPIAWAEANDNQQVMAELARLRTSSEPLPATLAELFQQSHPPITLLRQAKQWAKAGVAPDGSALPEGIAKLLYLLSIAVARLHGGSSISRLSVEELQRGFVWAIGRSWVDSRGKTLLAQALRGLPGPHSSNAADQSRPRHGARLYPPLQ